jgi:murein DD-endopeptidase MepM/ murein hydrolase activator NlpD
MYENGNQEYLAILFGATSIQDLLNRSEYVEEISDYDNQIFKEYKKIKEKVEKKEQQSKEKLQQLQTLETETKEEKEALNTLKSSKKKELKKYNKKLKKSQDKISDYSSQAAAAEKEVEKLLEQKQDEIDKELAAGGGNSGGSGGKLSWPLSGGAGRISSGFGSRKSPTAGASSYHKGLDIAISAGTPILAAGSGKVVTATYSSSAGNYVMVSHGNRLYTVYMHASRLAVSVGDTVSAGQVIAYVGSTGISTGAHLHFGVSKNGSYVNPLTYVSK